MICPEFETELVKKVLGQQAGRSTAQRTNTSHAKSVFNIDDKMLPYLLGADLSSGFEILRVLHKEILASTAEHGSSS